MPRKPYDLVIIGAGSGGLTAAAFSAQLGARTALVEKNRVGGDCTWTGCVPSKALLKAARVAHEIHEAPRYGIETAPVEVDMRRVRQYVRSAIQEVYAHETPERLEQEGIDVIQGGARFVDGRTIRAGDELLQSKNFLITTGARPRRPPIDGLDAVEFFTYKNIFDNDHLPQWLAVIGAGPLGIEMAQAYQRFGSQVTIIDPKWLPRDEPEARQSIRKVLEREGVRFVEGTATGVRRDGGQTFVDTEAGRVRCTHLLVAAGRVPDVGELDLENADVDYSERGIPVDDRLRTSAKHIYAAGDVLGAEQFTHLAGWQAFQAVRNALLPGTTAGIADLVPWVTYTDPEIAHVGLSEEAARKRLGEGIRVHLRPMSEVDRAIAEGRTDGFLKVVTGSDDTLVGVTIVADRAGELVGEFMLALRAKKRLRDLAGIIHPYPTYSTAIQQLAAEATVRRSLEGTSGRVIRGLFRLLR